MPSHNPSLSSVYLIAKRVYLVIQDFLLRLQSLLPPLQNGVATNTSTSQERTQR